MYFGSKKQSDKDIKILTYLPLEMRKVKRVELK
jgi:hypothetical protein